MSSSHFVSGNESACSNPACRHLVDACMKGAKYCSKGCRLAHLDTQEKIAASKQASAVRKQEEIEKAKKADLAHQKWLKNHERNERERAERKTKVRAAAKQAQEDNRLTLWSFVSKARYTPQEQRE